MKAEELIVEIKEYVKSIDRTKVYYTLRKLGHRRISDAQIEAVCIFIALRHFGIEIIGTNLFKTFYDKTRTAIHSILHLLGDRGVITLVHGKKNSQLRYVLNPKFTEQYREQKDLNTSSGNN